MTVGRRSPKPRLEPAPVAAPGAPHRQPARVQALAAQLAHDVGKYLARTARNLPPGEPLDDGLIDMLCRDLYGDHRGPPPKMRFAALAGELLPLLPDARLPQVGLKLDELAGLESGVRAAQTTAVARAVALALQVEQLLRALAIDCQLPAKLRTR